MNKNIISRTQDLYLRTFLLFLPLFWEPAARKAPSTKPRKPHPKSMRRSSPTCRKKIPRHVKIIKKYTIPTHNDIGSGPFSVLLEIQNAPARVATRVIPHDTPSIAPVGSIPPAKTAPNKAANPRDTPAITAIPPNISMIFRFFIKKLLSQTLKKEYARGAFEITITDSRWSEFPWWKWPNG